MFRLPTGEREGSAHDSRREEHRLDHRCDIGHRPGRAHVPVPSGPAGEASRSCSRCAWYETSVFNIGDRRFVSHGCDAVEVGYLRAGERSEEAGDGVGAAAAEGVAGAAVAVVVKEAAGALEADFGARRIWAFSNA